MDGPHPQPGRCRLGDATGGVTLDHFVTIEMAVPRWRGFARAGSLQWTPKTGPPVKLYWWTRGGEPMAGKRKIHGGLQGPGRPGRSQGRPHGQRAGRALRRPRDADPRLEEAADHRSGRDLGEPGQGGLG